MLYNCVFIIIIIIKSVGKHHAVYYDYNFEDTTIDMTELDILDCFFLSFFCSGYRDQIACSLLGGVSPIPEQRPPSH